MVKCSSLLGSVHDPTIRIFNIFTLALQSIMCRGKQKKKYSHLSFVRHRVVSISGIFEDFKRNFSKNNVVLPKNRFFLHIFAKRKLAIQINISSERVTDDSINSRACQWALETPHSGP